MLRFFLFFSSFCFCAFQRFALPCLTLLFILNYDHFACRWQYVYFKLVLYISVVSFHGLPCPMHWQFVNIFINGQEIVEWKYTGFGDEIDRSPKQPAIVQTKRPWPRFLLSCYKTGFQSTPVTLLMVSQILSYDAHAHFNQRQRHWQISSELITLFYF